MVGADCKVRDPISELLIDLSSLNHPDGYSMKGEHHDYGTRAAVSWCSCIIQMSTYAVDLHNLLDVQTRMLEVVSILSSQAHKASAVPRLPDDSGH